MNTKIIMVDENNMDMKLIDEAAEFLKKGEIVAFPTETVYGLGADATNKEAIKKIFDAKGRPQDNPLIVHIADLADLDRLILEKTPLTNKLIESFWPGPLTIIFKKSNVIPDITSAGLNTIGIRMPKNTIARQMILAAKVPIAAPSANISGRPSPTEVKRCIEDLKDRVSCILGGGTSEVGLESTIIDCTVDPACILRPGAITLEMLQEVEPSIYIDKAVMDDFQSESKPKAPGMKYRHYAPKAPLTIIQGDLQKTIEKINEIVQNYIKEGKKVGIIASEESKNMYNNAEIFSLGSRKDLADVGRNLFEALRRFDDMKVDVILSEAFQEEHIGIAVMNRLKKSSGYTIIKV